MNASEFKKLVNKYFSPNIRQLDWKGSGFHFYKPDSNHIVNIFGIQGIWFGGSVCCETAIHFDFIPDLSHKDKVIDISKTTYASCFIRNRLSPKGVGDHHWKFREDEEENIKSVNQIWEAFKTHGMAFYNDFANFPFPFDMIKPQELKTNFKLLDKYYIHNSIHFAWLLKEINLFIGRQDIAKDFSTLGFSRALENAKRMSDYSKSKKAKEDVENYIDTNKKMFTM